MSHDRERHRNLRRRILLLLEHAASSRAIGLHAEADTFAGKAGRLLRKHDLICDPDEGIFVQLREKVERWRSRTAQIQHNRRGP